MEFDADGAQEINQVPLVVITVIFITRHRHT